MSRSRKRTKKHGITIAKSEKQDKRFANRKLRRMVKQRVKPEEDILPVLREVSDIWAFAKDGKTYHKDISAKDMRK